MEATAAVGEVAAARSAALARPAGKCAGAGRATNRATGRAGMEGAIGRSGDAAVVNLAAPARAAVAASAAPDAAGTTFSAPASDGEVLKKSAVDQGCGGIIAQSPAPAVRTARPAGALPLPAAGIGAVTGERKIVGKGAAEDERAALADIVDGTAGTAATGTALAGIAREARRSAIRAAARRVSTRGLVVEKGAVGDQQPTGVVDGTAVSRAARAA